MTETLEALYYKGSFRSFLNHKGETVIQVHIKKKVGNSFETPSLSGNENLGPIQATSDIKEGNAVKRIFNLMDFYQFYEALLTFVSVDGADLLGPFDIGQVKNKKRKSVKSKSILNGEESKPRRFLFGELAYNQKVV